MKIADVNERWRKHALCRKYHVAVFTTSKVQVLLDDGVQDLRIGWVLGFLPNTEAEVLGLSTDVEAADAIVRNLHDRGVERMALVVDAGWHLAATAASGFFSRARPASSTEHFIRDVTSPPLPRRLRDVVAAGLRAAFDQGDSAALLEFLGPTEERVNRLQVRPSVLAYQAERLNQGLLTHPEETRRLLLAADRTAAVLLEDLAHAVQRNGYFLNQDAAIEFVAKALMGAERRMDRERAAVAAQVRTLRPVSEDSLAGCCAV